MKKILFVVDEREMGGVSVVLNDLVHLLDKTKYEIDILVLHDKGHMLHQLPEGVHLFFGTSYFQAIDLPLAQALKSKKLSCIISKLKIVWGLKTGSIITKIKKERKKILKKEYDVEIAYKDGFCALFCAVSEAPIKLHWLHCSYKTFNPNEKYDHLFQQMLPSFDRIIGVADNVVKEFNEIYHLESITEVIPVLMDVERIKKRSQEQALYQLDESKLNIVLIGRCHPIKGYDRMFNVIKQLKKESYLHKVLFTIIGDGPLYDKHLKRLNEDDIEDVVCMVGNVENPYAELKQYDLLFLPSFSEAFGTVISEAFILGVPVLASETSASLMSVKNGVNGFICENSEKGLYDGLKYILENRHFIHELKKNLVSFHYDNTVYLNRIEAILDGEMK